MQKISVGVPAGIEPHHSAWQSSILPQSHTSLGTTFKIGPSILKTSIAVLVLAIYFCKHYTYTPMIQPSHRVNVNCSKLPCAEVDLRSSVQGYHPLEHQRFISAYMASGVANTHVLVGIFAQVRTTCYINI
uniref:Uncharacterized protein n=1 Tax=Rhipicephalus microplus TaxID=6941 RepID=A0A6G5AG58_RHIMP